MRSRTSSSHALAQEPFFGSQIFPWDLLQVQRAMMVTSAGDRRGKPRGPSTIASPFSPTAITLVRTGREGCRIRLPGLRALRTSLKYLASVTTWPRTRGPVILITWLWLLFCLVTSSASLTRHGPVGVL